MPTSRRLMRFQAPSWPELEDLIERARKLPPMDRIARREQRKSFARGNFALTKRGQEMTGKELSYLIEETDKALHPEDYL